jgi:tetratricopeptide (TPR) repeat protein
MRSCGTALIALVVVSSVALGASACGGAAPEAEKPQDGAGSAAAPTADADLNLDLAKVELKGSLFAPEALARPPMPFVEGKKKLTIEKQRAVVAKAKDPALHEAMSQVLATQLYQASRAESGGKEKPLLEEGRQVMRDALKAAADPPDSNTLRMLGVFEILLGDFVAAAPVWERLTKLDPNDKEVDHFRAWWTYCLLVTGKNAEAAAAVKDLTPSLKSPELAYVMAWARWRAGDGAGAWQAMRAAAIGWPEKTKGSIIERDLILFAGRTGVSVPEAVTVVTAFAGEAKADQYTALYKLSQSMNAAGRYPDTNAAIDATLRAVGAEVPKQDPPKLRIQQAELTLRFDDPVSGARFGKQALEALTACGPQCADRVEVVAAVQRVATFYHTIYATSQDLRFYPTAHDLYAAVLPASEGAKKDEVQHLSDQLEQTKRNVRKGGGIHDKDIVAALLGLHKDEVQACYEAVLAAAPTVAGALALQLEFDATGAVTGASSTPPEGDADLAAVAKCALGRARTWRLPARGKPGVSRVKVNFDLSVRSAS